MNAVGRSAELFDVGLGFMNAWRPQIDALTSPLDLGRSLVIGGAKSRGISETSGGSGQNSPSDFPVLQLRSMESERTLFLLCTNWQTNSVISVPVWNFPPGYALATVFVNGIPGTGSVLNINVPNPISTVLIGTQVQSNRTFQFSFTNTPGVLFRVLATSNLTLPRSLWTTLGSPTEVSPGQFQFNDSQAASSPQRFYVICSP